MRGTTSTLLTITIVLLILSPMSLRAVPGNRRPLSPYLPKPASRQTTPPPHSRPRSRLRTGFYLVLFFYIAFFLALSVSHRAQNTLIYLNWLKPPFFFPLNDLRPYRLASTARVVQAAHLRGWHILPPGPPFSDGSDGFFERRLMHAERVVLFFHGNSGTRACPPKRVALIKLLAAQLHAHVVTFDYSGFGDSGGRPSEAALYADARDMYEWVRKRTSNEADIVVYGQSLGTFAAVDLMAHLSRVDDLPKGLILDAPPTSLIDAAMTHPVTLPFRIIPFVKRFMTWVLHDKLDSVEKIGEIRAPILILHGQEDAMIGVEQGRRLAEAARAAGCDITFVEFENCGHMDICGEETYLGNVHLFLGQILRRPIPQIS